MGKKRAAEIIGDNINRLMTVSGLSNVTLEKRLSGRVTKSTIGRIRNAENNSGIGNIEDIARAFGLDAWQLLIPDVDVSNPQKLASTDPVADSSLAASEQALVAKFRQLSPTFQSLLLADADKYLAAEQPADKGTAPTRRAS